MKSEENKKVTQQLETAQRTLGEISQALGGAATSLTFQPDNETADELARGQIEIATGKLPKVQIAIMAAAGLLKKPAAAVAEGAAAALLALMILAATVFGGVQPAQAVTKQIVDSLGGVAIGANVKFIVTAADYQAGTTTSNGSYVITNLVTGLDLNGNAYSAPALIASNSVVELAYIKVVQPFTTTNYANTNGVTINTYLTVGDNTTSNLFFSTTDLNAGQAPYPIYFPTATVLTNVTSAGNGTNGTPLTKSVYARTMNVYRANGCFVFTLGTATNTPMSAVNAGEADIYFRIVGPGLP